MSEAFIASINCDIGEFFSPLQQKLETLQRKAKLAHNDAEPGART
jgi:hypothetical protein